MKRKALITATAVLLVAVMCLATASYAWFTSGKTASINPFDLTVSAGEGSIMIAPATPAANGFTNNGYANVRNLADWTNIGTLPTNNTLTACSTTGTVADGATTPVFMGTTYDAGTWTADATVKNSYLLISFYAYSPRSTTADLTVDFKANDGGNLSVFESAVKVGLGVVDVAEENKASATKDTTLVGKGFGIYTLDSHDWDALVTAGGKVTRGTDGAFTGDTTDITVNNGALELADQEFTANVPKLYTVAIWLEGQDPDCYGDFDCGSIKCDVVFTEQTTNA